jgi:peptidoglycan/LPS O-acetylase OafA/YrhL
VALSKAEERLSFPATQLGHVPALDGLRGVAIALVFAHHFFALKGGFYGVDVFFVLSGFLITTLLLDERARHGTVSLRRFYGRRARRLLPALGALLAFSTVLAFGVGAHAWARAEGIVTTIFYTNNFDFLFRHRLPGELTQNWSLSEEEQFYVIWPTLLLLMLRRGIGVRKLASLLLAAAVALALWRTILVLEFGVSDHVYFGPDTRMDGLVLGCALAAARHARILSDGNMRRIGRLFPVGLAAIAASSFAFSKTVPIAYTLGLPVVEVASAMLIIAALAGSASSLALRPLVWIGTISYSLYLWLGFGALVGANAQGALAALLAAVVTYRFVERPFRHRSVADLEPAASLSPAAAG